MKLKEEPPEEEFKQDVEEVLTQLDIKLTPELWGYRGMAMEAVCVLARSVAEAMLGRMASDEEIAASIIKITCGGVMVLLNGKGLLRHGEKGTVH